VCETMSSLKFVWEAWKHRWGFFMVDISRIEQKIRSIMGKEFDFAGPDVDYIVGELLEIYNNLIESNYYSDFELESEIRFSMRDQYIGDKIIILFKCLQIGMPQRVVLPILNEYLEEYSSINTE